MGRRAKKLKTKKNQIEEAEDRLSSLPDSILVSILNCLPIDAAAVTSVLSRRWQFLWTQRDSIYFAPVEKLDKYKNFKYFINTFDHIISKLTALNFIKLTLDIPCVDHPKSSTFMLPWISKICSLNPKGIHLLVRDTNVESYSILLPPCLLQTHSLKSLILGTVHKIEFMLPDNGINLPNLKYIRLCLHDSYISLLGILTKSCPLLEYLSIGFVVCEKRNVVGDIIAPNLKYFSINCRSDFKLDIAAPKLEEIHFMCQLPFIHFVNKSIWLQKLSVDLAHVGRADDDLPGKIQGLFQQIPSLSFLDLGKSCPHLLNTLIDISLPNFLNVVHLNLHSNNIDESSRVPLGLLCKLKKVELSEVVGNGIEMKFLEHVLSNAPVLEELHISFCEARIDGREPERDHSRTKYKFCSDLVFLPQSSSKCQIKFSASRDKVFTLITTLLSCISQILALSR